VIELHLYCNRANDYDNDNDNINADILQDVRDKFSAVILAIKTFLEVKKREKLAALIGNYEFGYSLEDLEKMRQDG
jgi:hypothetical protein